MKQIAFLCISLILLLTSCSACASAEPVTGYEKILQIHIMYLNGDYQVSRMELRYGDAPNLYLRDGNLMGVLQDASGKEQLSFTFREPGIVLGDIIGPDDEGDIIGYTERSAAGEVILTVPYVQNMETFSITDVRKGKVLLTADLTGPSARFCTDYPQDPDCLTRGVPVRAAASYTSVYVLLAAVFTLSVLIAAAIAVIALRKKDAARQRERKTVLITDDDAEIVRLLSLLLEKRGFAILTASGGKECLETLKKQVPDLILLDIMMEPLDGWQTLEQIKKNPATKTIPTLMLTGKKLTPHEARRYKHCIDDYIQKPCMPQEIYAAVDSILERKRALKETLILAKNAGVEKEKVCELARLTRRMSVNRRIVDMLGVATAVPLAADLDELDAMSVAEYITIRNKSYEKQIEQLRAEINAAFRLKGLPEFPL
jgi:two-component system, OmpR family, response regulator